MSYIAISGKGAPTIPHQIRQVLKRVQNGKILCLPLINTAAIPDIPHLGKLEARGSYPSTFTPPPAPNWVLESGNTSHTGTSTRSRRLIARSSTQPRSRSPPSPASNHHLLEPAETPRVLFVSWFSSAVSSTYAVVPQFQPSEVRTDASRSLPIKTTLDRSPSLVGASPLV